MTSALFFILRTLFDLYLLTFALRLLMQWARVDGWNPIAQFIQRVTNPVVIPLRRLLPAIGRIDTGTVVALFGLQAIATTALLKLDCAGDADVLQILAVAGLSLVDLFLRIAFWTILIYVVLSWVSQGGGSPGARIVTALARPLLQPFRRLIPPIAGVDLSPLFAAIVLQALRLVLPLGQVLGGLGCGAIAGPAF
jgi:YggT family protein